MASLVFLIGKQRHGSPLSASRSAICCFDLRMARPLLLGTADRQEVAIAACALSAGAGCSMPSQSRDR